MLKGRQAGGLHRGHGWVFRAETYDTMMAWYEDIKNLTEKTGEERNAFVRRHARSVSGGSHKPGSISSDGALEEDEADEVPYSANASRFDQTLPQGKKLLERPQPGGRFPSDINIRRNLQVPLPPSSDTSSDDRDVVAAAGALPGSTVPFPGSEQQVHDEEQLTDASGGLKKGPAPQQEAPTQPLQKEDQDKFPVEQGPSPQPEAPILPAPRGPHGKSPVQQTPEPQPEAYIPIARKQEYNNLPVQQGPNPDSARRSSVKDETHRNQSFEPLQSNVTAPLGAGYNEQPVQAHGISSDSSGGVAYGIIPPQEASLAQPDRRRVSSQLIRPDSSYGEWMAPAAASAGGVAAGIVGAKMYQQREDETSPAPQSPVAQKTIFEPKQEPLTVVSNLLDEKVEQDTNMDTMASANEMAPYASPSEIEHFGSSPRSPRQVDAMKAQSSSPTTAHQPFGFQVSEMTQSTPVQTDEGQWSRPAFPHHTSVSTISDLHIPGEYPHSTSTNQQSK